MRHRGYITDADGKRHWYSYHDPKDKNRAMRQALERMASAGTIDRNMTFRAWVAEWQSTYRASESITMRKDTDGRLANYVFPYIGSMQMFRIRPVHLQAIFARTADKSASFNHKLYVTLVQIFRTAADNDIIPKSPMRGVIAPKSTSGKRRSLTDAEREALLAVCTGGAGSTLCLLALFCGLRPAEIAALHWRSVDLENSLISVKWALKRDGTIGPPKSAAGIRTVPIPAALLPYLQARAADGLVCPNTHGGPLTRTSIRWHWRQIAAQMHAPADLTLYCLRHTYCTDLERAGVPLNVAKRLMGHDDVRVTANIYTHTDADAIEKARSLIDESCRPRCQLAEKIEK